jgi:AcrR family transcriptional regulator
MRSAEDLTAAAQIRAAAMQLFAERGYDGVSLRDIAAAAGVSAALVIHHYKSKHGLKAAVDERVLASLEQMLADATDPADAMSDVGPLTAVIAQRFADEPALPGYLRRLLVDGGEEATRLLAGLLAASARTMDRFEQAGLVRPGVDDAARTLFLLVNDMAVLILRDQITALLGTDPLGAEGMARWSEVVLEIYANGFLNLDADVTGEPK